MRASISLVLVVWAGTAHAAVAHVPIKSSLVLKPGQIYTVTVEATQPTEIGWRAVQPKECTTNCVQMTEKTGGLNYTMATALGASKKYTPVAGKTSIEYKNVTSKDGSYSVISGVTSAGKPFSFRAVWWTDDKKAVTVNCSPFVKRYLDD